MHRHWYIVLKAVKPSPGQSEISVVRLTTDAETPEKALDEIRESSIHFQEPPHIHEFDIESEWDAVSGKYKVIEHHTCETCKL